MLLWLIVFSMAVLSLACAEDVHTHEYSDWQVKTPATCSSEGEEVRICATCGNVESRKIAATGNHSYSDWYIKDAPTCGDDGLEVRI